jgi:hypothetical protein
MHAGSTPPPFTSESHPSHPRKVWDDAVTLLSAVRSTLADLLEDVRSGEPGSLKEVAAKQAELETALKRAFEAEGRFHEWQAKQAGRDGKAAAAGVGEIDFDALRHDIACRLQRLRDCCQDD